MFTIDNMSRIPVYEQIVEQTERMLLSGEMKPGDPMPSVRGLAAELGVPPNTIQNAYPELEHRGMTTSVPGRGSFLREDATEQLVAYLNETALPEFKNMLKGMLIAGASKEESLVFIEKILDELADELDA